jgi:hypothetical protein
MKRVLFAGAMAILLFAGQAQAGFKDGDKNLKLATAAKVGNMLSDDVVLSEVKRGAFRVRWTATTPSGTYRCEATDMLENVNCVLTAAPTVVAKADS